MIWTQMTPYICNILDFLNLFMEVILCDLSGVTTYVIPLQVSLLLGYSILGSMACVRNFLIPSIFTVMFESIIFGKSLTAFWCDLDWHLIRCWHTHLVLQTLYFNALDIDILPKSLCVYFNYENTRQTGLIPLFSSKNSLEKKL